MNVWSGGAYSQNTSGLFSGQNITNTVSSDWSSKGDNSFLSVTSETSGTLVRLSAGSFDSGSYLLTMDVYNVGPSFKISFFGSSDNNQKVTIPESNEVTHVELTLTADNSNYLDIRVAATDGAKFYWDHASITPTVITTP